MPISVPPALKPLFRGNAMPELSPTLPIDWMCADIATRLILFEIGSAPSQKGLTQGIFNANTM